VLSSLLADDIRQVELFRLEAGAAASLSHGNIIKSGRAEEVNGVHFCVLEERPGTVTLNEWLKKNGWLDVDEAVRIGQRIADSLEYAHGQGVLHLALRPDEVLLDEEGNVLVSGFGIARDKHLLWAHQERSHRCPARYISPEQVISANVDQRSDLYLLGLLLFEMLTDRAPFESDDEASLRRKHLTRAPAPPHMFRDNISRMLSQTVLDLLAKRPDARPFCASTLKSALERCVAAGLIEDEKVEETQGAARSDEYPPPRLVVADVPSVSEQAPEEDQDAPRAVAVSGGTATALEADRTTAADGRVVDLDDDIYDARPDHQANFIDGGYETGYRAYEEEGGISDAMEMTSLRPSLPEARGYVPGESLTPTRGRWSERLGSKRSRRLAWLMALLLIGAGLFWGVRATRFHSKRAEAAVPSVTAGLRDKDKTGSPSDEITVYTPEVTVATEVIHSPSISSPVISATDGGPFDDKKAQSVIMKEEQAGETNAAKTPAPKQPGIAPPMLPPIGQDSTLRHDLPAGPFDRALNDAQPQEAAPVPEQPVAAKTPPPKVIRKSGDVLQNTAIIRPRPVYSKAARKADIKGAVTVEVTIDEEGSVVTARPISGPQQLQEAAVAAARRWKWVPEREGRSRMRVVGTITFNFKD
jgi:TonB family protein